MLLHTLKRALTRMEALWRRLSGHQESPEQLGEAAQRFWSNLADPVRRQDSHWRGQGIFADDALWLGIGQGHLDLFKQVLAAHRAALPTGRAVEWGCGGGANAVHFGRGCTAYFGVDISAESLDECARQMRAEGLQSFVPVCITANRPRDAVQTVGGPVDLFLCLYVMELLPSEPHALEVLDIARDMLRPRGWAMVQIRRRVSGLAGSSRPWDYESNMAYNVRFSVEDFTQACQQRRLQVRHVELRDEVPELRERDYAYFFLERMED